MQHRSSTAAVAAPNSMSRSRSRSSRPRGCIGHRGWFADLRELGWTVSEKTVADSMRRQGLVARKIRRRGGLTRQDKAAPKFPDPVKRNFTATAPNCKWLGDMTENPTESGKLTGFNRWMQHRLVGVTVAVR